MIVHGLKIFLIVCLLMSSFTSFSAQMSHENSFLIDYSYEGEFPQNIARMVLEKTPFLEKLEARYTLDLYKIHYRTYAPDGQLTLASGLVAMPRVSGKPVGIVSYQHGTRFTRTDVPSRNSEKNYVNLATIGSYAGYMAVMPDYLGLGDNELPLHPYVQADTLASSSVDMLLAAKELAASLHYALNDKLYLTGYSEGGFTTLVMFELMGEQYKQIPVTAVALGSAPYDWEETMRFIMLKPGPRATAYLAYFFYSLQYYKNYWSNLDEIFIPPYNHLVVELFDGQHSHQDILQALPQNPIEIFQPQFFDAILNQKDRNSDYLKQLFNHYFFTPTAPLLLIGTKGDKDVPYHGAEIAYEVFSQYSDQVSIRSVSDELDHIDAAPLILREQLEYFKSFD